MTSGPDPASFRSQFPVFERLSYLNAGTEGPVPRRAAEAVHRRIDLETDDSSQLGDDYDGIIVTNYLHRPLLPAIARALAPGGVLIYETFARGNERFGRPCNPDFLLRPGELLEAFTTRSSPSNRERFRYHAPP